MEEPPRKQETIIHGGFSLIGEDIHRNILSRLPALSFSAAAVVSRSWNRLCTQILTRPKLRSALSLNPCLENAVNEALDKVLSEPIRPDFAIACVGINWKDKLVEAHRLVRKRLSSTIPIITNVARGIIGSDASTSEFKEVKWVGEDEDGDGESKFGVGVIVGFMPGMKVKTFPYYRPLLERPQVCMMERFVSEIEGYTFSVSGCTSPSAILMFADQYPDMEPLLDKMDYSLSEGTVIMGDESGHFMFSSGDDSTIVCGSRHVQAYDNCICDAVALVFATDRDKSCDMEKIQFNLAVSSGLSPVGAMYKGASVRVTRNETLEHEGKTWLTARREGFAEEFDGNRILDDIENEMGNDISSSDLYIGVTKRRKCSIGSKKGKLVSKLAFHDVLGGDEEYLYVKGGGIKTGDCFHLYKPDPAAALLSCNTVSEELRILKLECEENGDKKEVFGGLLFSCFGRGDSFLGRRNADSSVFLNNFPGVPFGGIFCCGEIARGSSSSTRKTEPRQCLHVYSAVYLIMSYTPKPLEC